jgi:Domain of unknown function (DUF4288)
MNKYIGITLMKSSADNKKDLYSENITLVKAESIDEARKKLKDSAESENTSYKNKFGNTVTWSFLTIVDVAEVLEDDVTNTDCIDLYTRHFSNISAYNKFEPFMKQ